MRWIEKSQEPESFTRWKAQANEDWQPRFDNLRSQEKRDLYAALLQEQGYLSEILHQVEN
ncbi:MAG: hypothetical protein F6K31_13335 [Symploca sp. SIO2G7]|nr:hypothetical protein [Symploca sp. SIO2G7]